MTDLINEGFCDNISSVWVYPSCRTEEGNTKGCVVCFHPPSSLLGEITNKAVHDNEKLRAINRVGNPSITWEPFRLYISDLNSSEVYLKIHQF
ncbi:MAG: hypothetical protein JW776_12325 [Candidatus Lokiarchaeota archaeon]|nr:hypothetical protein [Candidatus Lokiarchaeota archaeon]